ncbi:MAG: right-handed parallel beta-helix repeat-containing protein [Planctomycetota bacterium]|jgi:hypothetical protein
MLNSTNIKILSAVIVVALFNARPLPAQPLPDSWADRDGDSDVDQEDYWVFEACGSGPAIPFPQGCNWADADSDGDVDQEDFGEFQICYSGQGNYSPCAFTTYYVSTSGNDANNGLSPTDQAPGVGPWQHIQHAIDNAASLNNQIVIDIAAGIYNVSNDGLGYDYLLISETQNDNNYILKGTPDETIIVNNEGTVYVILANSSHYSGTFTLKNLTVQYNHAADAYGVLGIQGYADYVIENCTINVTGDNNCKGVILNNYFANTRIDKCTIDTPATGIQSGTIQYLNVNNCSITTQQLNFPCIGLYGFLENVSITNNNLTAAGHYAVSQLSQGIFSSLNVDIRANDIYNSRGGIRFDTLYNFNIVDNNITIDYDGDNSTYMGIALGGDLPAYRNAYNGIIRGNTIQYTGSAVYSAHTILLGAGSSYIEVDNNIVAGGNYQIVCKGSNCHIHHNICKGPYSIFVSYGTDNIIEHNSCYATRYKPAFCWNINQPSLTSGDEANAVVVQNNQTVQLAETDLTYITAGQSIELVGRNDGLNGSTFFEIVHIRNLDNQVDVFPVPANAGGNYKWRISGGARNNTIRNNIFDITGGGNYSLRSHKPHWNNNFDYNLYASRTGIAVFLRTGFAYSQAMLIDLWDLFSNPQAPDNDQHSIVTLESPFVYVDPSDPTTDNDDFHLKEGSEALMAGYPLPCTDIGKYQQSDCQQ